MKKIFLLCIWLITVWGCAVLSRTYRLGYEAELNRKWDEAVKYYERAVLENPKESVYRLALVRVKMGATLFHLQEARNLVAQGKKEEAKLAYGKALSYDPLNRMIIDEAKALEESRREEEKKPKKDMMELPFKLKGSEEKIHQMRFQDASLRSIFQALGKFAGVNVIFDENFRDIPLSIDLVDTTFEQAFNSVCLASKNFYRIIDEKTVIVAPDQPMKRMQYELNAIKTFYLSNINAQDIQQPLLQMLRTQYKAPNIIIDKNLNSVTIRDTPQVISLAEKLIKNWDKPKGEVIIDLEIMEVSRIKLRQLGISFDQNLIGLRYSGSGATADPGWFNLKEIDLSKAENYHISLPASFIQFLESDADTKIIAQPRLRGVGEEEIKSMVGQKVPIPQTSFVPFAAGGISQQPVVSYTYQDVGIDIKIKPKIHFEREITLELELKITSIGGTGVANIPIIVTREIKNVIRLKNGETNLLAGLLRDEERKSLRGIPGIKDVPILGALFSSTDQTLEQTDVVLTITPYIIRSIPLAEEDMKPLWVDLEGLSSVSRAAGIYEEELLEREATFVIPQRIEEAGRKEEEEGQNLITLSPASFEVPRGREFRIAVNVSTTQEITSMSFNINFPASILKLKEVLEGGSLRQLGEKVPFLRNIDNNSGLCTIGFSSPDINRGLKGGGNIAVLVFEASNPGEGKISISGVSAIGLKGQTLSFRTSGANIFVR